MMINGNICHRNHLEFSYNAIDWLPESEIFT